MMRPFPHKFSRR